MYSVVTSGAIYGIDAYMVKVEADAGRGLPGFEMVGMPSGEVKEAKERVKVALKNIGITFPPMHITVNFSPANVRKSGTSFDLPIAISLLVAMGEIDQESLGEILLIGELGLNGQLQFAKGVLPIVIKAKESGIKTCLVPEENAKEGAVVEGIKVVGIKGLAQAIEYLKLPKDGRDSIYPPTQVDLEKTFKEKMSMGGVDFGDVSGQEGLKRAAMIATAGFHHMLMIGPPGAGKTMIAKRIPTILPKLSMEESLEVTKIYSIAGVLKENEPLKISRPFSAPHHTVSDQALVGGGTIPKPGAVSLAHRGVLFLDEAVHFSSSALEVLRQPMEDRKVVIARSMATFTYPADFMLVAAINPCPCGYYPDRNKCTCSEEKIQRYLSKISGPILDRIDICVEASGTKLSELKTTKVTQNSENMRKMVMKARKIQEKRYEGTPYQFNGEIGPNDIAKYCHLGREEEAFMDKAFKGLNLSARGYHKILKVARTIADLDGSEDIKLEMLAEAISYRMSNQTYW